QDVNSQLVGVGIVDCDELHTGIHEGGDKCEIADRRSSFAMTSLAFCFLHAARAFLQFWPVASLAALDLCELGDELPPAPIQVVEDGLALSLQAKARLALPIGTDAVIGDKFSLMRWHSASNGLLAGTEAHPPGRHNEGAALSACPGAGHSQPIEDEQATARERAVGAGLSGRPWGRAGSDRPRR